MIAVIDYDAGNIRSVLNAMASMGQEAVLTSDKKTILSADRIILPGVGAFGDAMGRLRERGLVDVIRQAAGEGIPFLGICLGLQLLFESSEESPGVEGLGLLQGTVKKFPKEENGRTYKVPEIGWNDLSYPTPGRLFAGVPEHSYVYFVHSYYAHATDRSIAKAVSTYAGVTFDASVERGNVFACQFHPEKSGSVGRIILENFLAMTGGAAC